MGNTILYLQRIKKNALQASVVFIVMFLCIESTVLAGSDASNGFGSTQLEDFIPPEEMIARMIKSGKIERWAIIAKIDIDQDGDLDELMASDYSESGGTVLWRVYFVDKGKYYYLPFGGTFSSRLDMFSFGPLEQADGHPAFVTYTKDSASTGITSAVWFEKIGEKEVVKHERTLREVDVSYGSETAEEDKAFNQQLFSKLGPIEFAEYKRYSREEAIEAFDISIEEEGGEPESSVEDESKSEELADDEEDDQLEAEKGSKSNESDELQKQSGGSKKEQRPNNPSSSMSMIVVLGVLALVLFVAGAIVVRGRMNRADDAGR